jgi:hypothetical protein
MLLPAVLGQPRMPAVTNINQRLLSTMRDFPSELFIDLFCLRFVLIFFLLIW